MLLVTTSHPRTCRADSKILLLGEWCRRAVSPRIRTDIRVVPYHWDDRAALEKDFRYLDTLHERWLPHLADRLNAVHGTGHPVAYWRLVAGFWFKLCATVLYDRFRSLEEAAAHGPGLRTLALLTGNDDLVAHNIADFVDRVTLSDLWNHHCYLALAEHMDGFAIEPLGGAHPGSSEVAPSENRHAVRAALRRAAVRVSQFATRRNRIAAISIYVPPRAAVALAWHLGEVPLLGVPPIPVRGGPLRSDLRQALSIAGDTPFERSFGALLPHLAPRSLVEDYGYLRDWALAAFPKRPRVILTTQFHVRNDALCIWAAEKRLQGADFRIVQHGGHYGVDRFESQEDHELRVADRYYSWGWTRKGFGQITPMPAMQISGGRRFRTNPHGPLLFVYDTMPPYAYRLYCVPIASQGQWYASDQAELIAALPEPLRAASRLRLHPASDAYHFPLRRTFSERGWAALIDEAREPLDSALGRARLCVATTNATVYLQTLATNYPTLLYWNPRYNELRPEVKEDFKALAEAGILHYEPASAARALAEAFGDVESWWASPAVQAARRRFVARYARTAPDWARLWARELKAGAP
jgi:putative transferase (TIGR04331 family)